MLLLPMMVVNSLVLTKFASLLFISPQAGWETLPIVVVKV